jgi:benzoate membrane transport protein
MTSNDRDGNVHPPFEQPGLIDPRAIAADFNAAAFWAGVTAFVWYAFGATPLLIAVASGMGLSTAQVSSWFFIVMFGAAAVSIPLCIVYRQPIQIGWTLPGLVFLASLADRFSFPELVGANIMAGAVIVALGVFGIGRRIMSWIPLPIVMGMFAGSILGMILRLIEATVSDVTIAGAAVAGYLIGRAVRSTYLPPVGLALVLGGVAVAVTDRLTAGPLAWAWPQLVAPGMEFTLPAFVAVSLPMVVLAMGLGNVQALGFLMGQGYRVPVSLITALTGVNTMVNALLGGHPASVARAGSAMLASPEAGPLETRYWAGLVANVLTLFLALGASVAASLAGILPASYLAAIGGLAILSAFQEAMERTFGAQPLKLGALTAFLVAATPFVLASIPSAFWAVIAGLLASLIVERKALFAQWKTSGAETPTPTAGPAPTPQAPTRPA